MFRLEHEISKWCTSLTRKGHLRASQIEELRDHLYNEVEKQQALDNWFFEKHPEKPGNKRLKNLKR